MLANPSPPLDLSAIVNTVLTGKGDSDKHLLTLFGVALSCGAKNILELGVRGGGTTLPLLLAAQATNGILTSVDLNPTEFKCPPELAKYWNFVQSDAIEFLQNNAEPPYDLIYIDDWHAYAHVKKELELIDSMVTPKTVVLLHDLMYGNNEPRYHADLTLKDGQWAEGGPYRAVAELNPQFWEFSTIPSNNGLTILRKKYSSKFYS
jgi:predicted O-methyltransferase YrrM